jgi:hypothetical protein
MLRWSGKKQNALTNASARTLQDSCNANLFIIYMNNNTILSKNQILEIKELAFAASEALTDRQLSLIPWCGAQPRITRQSGEKGARTG